MKNRYLILIAISLIIMMPIISADLATEQKIEDLSKKLDTTMVTKEELIALDRRMDSFVTKEELLELNKKLDSFLTKGEMSSVINQSYRGSITVHGTEYSYGQIAKVWLQLLNSQGQDISNGTCYTDIYTPSGDYFLERVLMTNMVHDGIYYYDLAVPIASGVYPVIATCYYESGQTNTFAQAVHMINGTLDSGTVDRTWVLDGIYLGMTESSLAFGNPRRISTQFNFTTPNICTNISESLLNGISVSWTGRWNSNVANDVLTIQLYNHTSGQWINLSNTITGAGTGVKTNTNSLSFNNISKTGLVNSTGSKVLLRIVDTVLADTSSSGFDTDYLSFQCDQLSNATWQQVSGSSELHVTSGLDYLEELQLNAYTINTTQNVTLYNGTAISEIYYTGIFNHKFTISSGVSEDTDDVLIEYQGLHAIPCNSIISFYFVNATGYYPYPYLTQAQTDEGHCSINFYLNLSVGEIYNFEVHARNTWESELRSTNTAVGSIYPLVNSGCLLWQILKGYPSYIIPKNQTNEQYDYYYRACANFYDDYYWFNQTYTEALLDKNKIADEQTFLQYESDYFSSKFAQDKLNLVTSSLLDNLEAIALYSKLIIENPLAPLTNMSDQSIWAQYSTVMQSYSIVNASCGTGTCKTNVSYDVWNANNRSLTYYPDATINATEVGDAVWSSNATISPNILSQIATSIWNYVARYIHGEILT